MSDQQPPGPYEDLASALTDAEPVYRAARRNDLAELDELNSRKLTAVLETTGVETGAYDRRVLAMLANFDPEEVQVFAAIIERAHAAGRDQLSAEMEDLRARIAPLEAALGKHLPPMPVDIATARMVAEWRRTV